MSPTEAAELESLGSPVGSEPLPASTPAFAAVLFKMFSCLTVTGAPCRWETKKENKTTGGHSSRQKAILCLARSPGPLTGQHGGPGWLSGTTFCCRHCTVEDPGFLVYVGTERKSILIWEPWSTLFDRIQRLENTWALTSASELLYLSWDDGVRVGPRLFPCLLSVANSVTQGLSEGRKKSCVC